MVYFATKAIVILTVSVAFATAVKVIKKAAAARAIEQAAARAIEHAAAARAIEQAAAATLSQVTTDAAKETEASKQRLVLRMLLHTRFSISANMDMYITNAAKQRLALGMLLHSRLSTSANVNRYLDTDVIWKIGNFAIEQAKTTQEDLMFIKVNLKGRKCIDVVEKECPAGYGLASGSKGTGFYYRDSPNLPLDLQREWNYRQKHKEKTPNFYFSYYKPE